MRRSLLENKQGGFTDLFLVIIFAFIILVVSGVMIYVGNLAEDELHEKMDDMDIGGEDQNVSQIIDDTMGKVNQSYALLSWLTVMIIFGMVFGVFFGSYKVRTQPIYFIPYLLLTFIAIIVSVGVANSYEEMIAFDQLSSSFATLTGGNYFMLHLPMFIGIIGVVGGIIMFISWATREETIGGYG